MNSWSSDAADNEDVAPEAASAWFDALDSDSVEESSEDSSSTSEEDENNTATHLSEVMKHTEDILDQLIRLGLAIRKSGSGSRLRKADDSFKMGDYQDLQRYLGLILLAQADKQQDNQDKTVKERTIDLDKRYDDLSREQKHIIAANLRRRHRFVYARRHQKKLEQPLDIGIKKATKMVPQPIQTPSSAAPNQGVQPLVKTTTENYEVNRETREVPMTLTTASAVEGDILKAVAAPSHAASRVSLTTTKMSYPLPPPIREGMRSFKCPCCYQTLPVMFRERSRWRYALFNPYHQPQPLSPKLAENTSPRTYVHTPAPLLIVPKRPSCMLPGMLGKAI